MIDWDQFEDAVVEHLNRDIRETENENQHIAVSASQDESQFIVAGPGSGKTTVIVLKTLKLVYVDGINPSNILITTFTKKAAAELDSRILGWSDELRQVFLNSELPGSTKDELRQLDFNRVQTGTLDSIAQDVLSEYREPGAPAPSVIEDFVSHALMLREGLFFHGRHNDDDLADFLDELRAGSWPAMNTSQMVSNLISIKERTFHDQIDIDALRDDLDQPGASAACDAIDDYINGLEEGLLYDYALLENHFLQRLRSGDLDAFLENIQFVLVDEYQDTNLLQEQIYFALADAAINNGGSLTVVGDDDQSLYRFRGATVDLFREFENRATNHLGLDPTTIYLSNNYRSTPEIVNFCNEFVTLDDSYQDARVPGKPSITTAREGSFENYPVLGMFRDDVQTLGQDLSEFLQEVFRGDGVTVETDDGEQFEIRAHPSKGSPADVAVLCDSPRERSGGGNVRLPQVLRNQLQTGDDRISVFNPRGQDLYTARSVQRLCGLILECIDPGASVEDDIETLPQDAVNTFREWRSEARDYIDDAPTSRTGRELNDFVDAWRSRGSNWSTDVPLADLVYRLITWIPQMQDDIEGLVYLEAVQRTITQAALFGTFGSELRFDPDDPDLERRSIRDIYWNILVPLATGSIDIDEELLETLPRDRLNIMSIHQAKGLEFPLVVVDVGSDFRTKHYAQAFKRYPRNGTTATILEDELRDHSPIGTPSRPALDRAFDDLIRKYFVAFSRAQDALLLVGLNSVKDGYQLQSGDDREIPNIATGWDRDRNWCWGAGLNNLTQI